MKPVLLSVLTIVMLASAARADEATRPVTLNLGDKAPALSPGKWVQGEPVSGFASGKVYVVEFWATWCGPCRTSIPHLNAMQKEFADQGVVVIGQNVWEHGADAEGTVSEFIQKMGDKMTYRVALDDLSGGKPGAMAASWMQAAGQQGIPAAFVVDQTGTIVWMGHPMSGLDEVLQQVIAGTYDMQKARDDLAQERQQAAEAAAQRAAFAERLKPSEEKLQAAMEAKDWDRALEAADEMEKALADTPMAQFGGMDRLRFHILTRKQDGAGAAKLAGALAEKSKEDPETLNELSWTLLTAPGLEPRDLELARRLAEAANALASGNDAAILDTLARAQFMLGEKGQAIRIQEQAIAAVPDDDHELKRAMRETLAGYQRGELPDPAAAGGDAAE